MKPMRGNQTNNEEVKGSWEISADFGPRYLPTCLSTEAIWRDPLRVCRLHLRVKDGLSLNRGVRYHATGVKWMMDLVLPSWKEGKSKKTRGKTGKHAQGERTTNVY